MMPVRLHLEERTAQSRRLVGQIQRFAVQVCPILSARSLGNVCFLLTIHQAGRGGWVLEASIRSKATWK